MSENKTHYRKVFKSDHLGRADLEDYSEAGHNLIFTIKHVRQEYGTRVAGRKIDANIAYFTDDKVKPFVVNAGNSKLLSQFANSVFVQDWNNIPVQLYVDPKAQLKGAVVGGIRISPNQPRMQKLVITPDNKKLWNRAKQAYSRDGNFTAVLNSADISEANMALIMKEVSNV